MVPRFLLVALTFVLAILPGKAAYCQSARWGGSVGQPTSTSLGGREAVASSSVNRATNKLPDDSDQTASHQWYGGSVLAADGLALGLSTLGVGILASQDKSDVGAVFAMVHAVTHLA